MKLLFESATLSKSLLFKELYISKAVILFLRATSSGDIVFLNGEVLTANLTFTDTLSIDHLSINTTDNRVFRLKLPGDAAPLK